MPPPLIPAAPPAPGPLDDVTGLMQGSRPQPTVRWLGRAVMAIWVVALVGPLVGVNAPALEAVALTATLVGGIVLSVRGAALRRETNELQRLEGLLALRRIDEAVPGLATVMNRPMHAVDNRLRAMLLLGATLARLGRNDDALAVYNELIDAEGLAGPGGAVVKLARAQAMLRADHLYDADGAINDLRRLIDRGGVAAEVRRFDPDAGGNRSGPDNTQLAGLRLVELYRDVKTGHLAEAVEHFDAQLPLLRSGLGHRVAEAHALVALALHRLSRPADAAARFADATALAPLSDLVRRYPELWPLCNVYTPTPPPR